MIDHNAESLLTMTDASKLLPGRPDAATLWRWRTKGVRGVKLESILYGGRRVTSREALDRFVERLNSDGSPERPTTPRKRQREIDRAERLAQKMGI